MKSYMDIANSNPYARRRLLRSLEKNWARFEHFINRFVTSNFNPVYHLGTLTIFLSILLFITGVYLTIIYRPGIGNAYRTVEFISSTWFGSLMRSMHKYASDGLIIVIILHFLKMLFSDRFWGARWLAWTSGWIMLAVIWLVGTMGYWLVWDQRAQWLTELMMEISGGTSALTYVAADLPAKTFSNFVIILFLHVFIPLLGFLAIYIHVLRLSRAQWWAPRWLMIQSTIGLALLAIIKPVSSALPADLSQVIASAPMDSLYLGFLPLMDRWGNLIVTGLAIFIFGGLFLLPWLWRGENLGPALVAAEKCTGCTLCFSECPYDAIRMIASNDNTSYEKLATINPAQCTGCGVCVGACPDDAMSLSGMAIGDVISELTNMLESEKGKHTTVLITGQRELALQSLPAKIQDPAQSQALSMVPWGTENSGRVVTMVLPSTGAFHLEWMSALRNSGASDFVILTSPYDDGIYREDPQWVYNRLRRRPALINHGLHWLEATPGDTQHVKALLDELHQKEDMPAADPSSLPVTNNRVLVKPPFKAALLGTILLTLLMALTLVVDVPLGRRNAGMAGMRLALDAKGKISQANIPENVDLPPGADPQEIFGGSHYPLSLRLLLNDDVSLEQTYQPAGISKNGRISAVEYIDISPGMYHVQLFIRDDDQDFRLLFDRSLDFSANKVILLEYNEDSDSFSIHK